MIGVYSGKDISLMFGFLTMGACFMCPKRELFYTYEEFDGSVLMGNNASCEAIGTRNIKSWMFDSEVLTLMNMRHGSKLKQNITFLDSLDPT